MSYGLGTEGHVLSRLYCIVQAVPSPRRLGLGCCNILPQLFSHVCQNPICLRPEQNYANGGIQQMSVRNDGTPNKERYGGIVAIISSLYV